MTRGERIRIQGKGLTLDGLLWVPKGSAVPGVVLCHPHPLHGGTMTNFVITALWESLAAAGLAVLRFNFRGVGRSEGSHDEGVGELDDVRTALSHLATTPGVVPDRLALAGYSFGSWVGARAIATVPQVRALALVAPPLGAWSFENLEAEPRPKLVVVGDRDDYCPLSLLLPWFARLPEPKEKAVLEGTDHFFGGREQDAAAAVAGFFARNGIGGGPS